MANNTEKTGQDIEVTATEVRFTLGFTVVVRFFTNNTEIGFVVVVMLGRRVCSSMRDRIHPFPAEAVRTPVIRDVVDYLRVTFLLVLPRILLSNFAFLFVIFVAVATTI